jgi:hypothetical protein
MLASSLRLISETSDAMILVEQRPTRIRNYVLGELRGTNQSRTDVNIGKPHTENPFVRQIAMRLFASLHAWFSGLEFSSMHPIVLKGGTALFLIAGFLRSFSDTAQGTDLFRRQSGIDSAAQRGRAPVCAIL